MTDCLMGLRPRWLECLLPAVVGVVLAVGMTWPFVLDLGSDIGKDLGDPLFQAWQVAWIGHALLHQPLHLFQANTFWPLSDSLAFSDALLGYAPAGLAAQQDPHAALVVYNLLFLFAYALAFVGGYLLACELGAGRLGGTAAGAAFAYAPWRLAQNGHLHVISSGGIPLALFLLVRGYRRGSGALVLVGWLVAAWQMTLGFTLGLQLAYLLGVLAVVVGVGWWRRDRRLDRTVVVASVAGVCVLALVVFVQSRPYLRVIDEHPEARRTPAVVAGFSPPLKGFLAAPQESFLWGGATARMRNRLASPPEETLFPGATVTLLALLGLVGPIYPRRLRFGLAAGVAVSAALSVGLRDVSGPKKYVLPYRFLHDFAPGWDGVRTPGRINTLTSLGLALLAAAGLCFLLRRAQRLTRSRPHMTASAAQVALAVVVIGAILVEGLGPLAHPRVPPVPFGQRRAAAPELHLPTNIYTDLRYSYWSVGDFPEIVNGAAGFEPTSLARLREIVNGFPDAASVAALRRLGVRTVVVHPELARGTPLWTAARRSIRGLLLDRKTVDGVILYRLRPSG